ncbi:hypothetical protein NGA76_10220 [Lactococcus formosensis]|uniref:hypothetical protein n=1 Tax=Lactococcus formosensis TaxID=1281486 RepID=UPI0024351552|nr:hypothetical protein [Lactococcus formosensis]MDG6161803.1 hypothetical protein [Lactococcus formosensis]MDG6171525.1 hypothetical protein [Lactococcus formosensis]
MKSSWRRQRLVTKNRSIKQIRYKKSVFKQFHVDITPFNGFTSKQIYIGFKKFFKEVAIQIQKYFEEFREVYEAKE